MSTQHPVMNSTRAEAISRARRALANGAFSGADNKGFFPFEENGQTHVLTVTVAPIATEAQPNG